MTDPKAIVDVSLVVRSVDEAGAMQTIVLNPPAIDALREYFKKERSHE